MKPGPENALGVGELTRALKRMIEDGFPAVWVRGEISNLRRQASGHSYFSLKDSTSQISAVLFRGNALRIDCEPADGRQVIAFGEVSVYEPRGNYQLIVRDLIEDGIGRLQREFERLKKKLREEGLFEADRKKPLPGLPLTVGVVTSASGAAIRDMISVFRRRDWRGRLRVFPSLVQGRAAAPALVERIGQAGRMEGLDLLVVARGGGSLEDLWCFNDEAVARALAACPVPTISAIGHETDVVLTDFVADLRKETPTGAAEWISSALLEARQSLADQGERLSRAVEDGLAGRLERLDRMRSRASARPFLRRVEGIVQRLDEWRDRIDRAVERGLADRLRGERGLRDRLLLRRPDRERDRRRREATELGRRLDRLCARAIADRRERLERLLRALRTGGLEGTLRRGFALVRGARGHPASRAAALAPGERISLRFHDGTARATVDETAESDGES